MRIILFIFLSMLVQIGFGKTQTIAYFFPGQGSDSRIFSKIKLDSTFRIVHIIYPAPEKNVTLAEYAKIISKQIDTTQKYILVGVSIGGMLCCELADYLHPEKIIIISSARYRSELPFRYRFQKIVPLNKIVPKGVIKIGAQILQPIVEPDRNKEKAIFKSMLKSKNSKYYKRTVNMIINWNRTQTNSKIIHIHGAKDHTIPIRNLTPNYIIKNGSHMITLTRGEEINSLLLTILKKGSK